MITVRCEICSATVQVPEKYAGRVVECRRCNSPIHVPGEAVMFDQELDRDAGLEQVNAHFDQLLLALLRQEREAPPIQTPA